MWKTVKIRDGKVNNAAWPQVQAQDSLAQAKKHWLCRHSPAVPTHTSSMTHLEPPKTMPQISTAICWLYSSLIGKPR